MIGIFTAVCMPALADTWDGGSGVDSNWTTGANWVGDTAPLGNNGEQLLFAGSSRTTNTNDFTAGTRFSGIAFTSADSYTLNGNAVTIDDTTSIINASSVLQTINLDVMTDPAGNRMDFTLNNTGNLIMNGNITAAGAGTTVYLSTNNGSTGATLTLAGDISGTTSLYKFADSGRGTVILSGNNTFTGDVGFFGGTLLLGSNTALSSGTLNIANTGFLTALGATGGARTIANDVNLNGAGLVDVVGSSNLTLDGLISNVGGLNVNLDSSTVVLTLNGNNNYSGGTTLTQGILAVGDNNALGSGSLTVAADLAAGNAQLQAAGGAITLANGITLNEDLALIGSNNLTLNGQITGISSLNIFNSAPATITNVANDYSGGTNIYAGTLLVTGDTLGSGAITAFNTAGTLGATTNAVTLTNNVTIATSNQLNIGGTENLTLNGAITGAGTLALNQNGVVLTLGGANTNFTGTVSYTAPGTLRLTNVDAVQNATVNVGIFGALDINGLDANIGQLAGLNNVVFGSQTVSVGGNDTDATYSGQINGTGILNKTGTGTWTLTGNSGGSFTGTTNVNEGTLVNNGTLGGDLNVSSGATLMGTGSTPNGLLTVNSGGHFAPGNSIGSYSTGSFALDSGSNLDIEVNPAAANTVANPTASTTGADFVTASGTATLADGSIINIMGEGGADIVSGSGASTLAAGQTYYILHADGGITDNGATVPNIASGAVASISNFYLGFFKKMLVNSDQDLAVTVAAFGNGVDAFTEITASTANPSMGTSLDQVNAIASDDVNAGHTDTPAVNLINDLSGLTFDQFNSYVQQVHAGANTAAVVSQINIDVFRAFNNQTTTYLAERRNGTEALAMYTKSSPLGGPMLASSEMNPALMAYAMAAAGQPAEGQDQAQPAAQPKKWSVWAKPYGVFSNVDTTSNRAGYQADSYGIMGGLDYELAPDFVLGLSLGYTHTKADLKQSLGDIDADNFRVGPYFSYSPSPWYVEGSVTYGYTDYDSTRNQFLPAGSFDSGYHANDITAYLGAGWTFDLTDQLALTPIGSLYYIHFDREGYTESGGAGSISYGDYESDALYSRVGARLSYRFQLQDVAIIPEVMGGWEHEYLNDNADTSATFNAGGTSFNIPGVAPESDSAFVGAGVSALIHTDLSVFVRYDGIYNSTSDIHAVTGGVTLWF